MPVKQLHIVARRKGFYNITEQLSQVVREVGYTEGLCTVFIQHTSASLLIQENADPAVRHDLENWMSRLVVEGDPLYTHTTEGADDMPAHIRSVLTATSLSIPIINGHLGLGTWQGVYLWEHRHYGGTRQVLIHLAA
jgi:secondary thiamine-phosphate synthase enzyme